MSRGLPQARDNRNYTHVSKWNNHFASENFNSPGKEETISSECRICFSKKQRTFKNSREIKKYYYYLFILSSLNNQFLMIQNKIYNTYCDYIHIICNCMSVHVYELFATFTTSTKRDRACSSGIREGTSPEMRGNLLKFNNMSKADRHTYIWIYIGIDKENYLQQNEKLTDESKLQSSSHFYENIFHLLWQDMNDKCVALPQQQCLFYDQE